MIRLDKLTGEIIIGELIIAPDTTIRMLNTIAGESNREIHLTNNNRTLYRIPLVNKGENAVLLVFFEERLKLISLGMGKKYGFPPFKITEAEKQMVKQVLSVIGGEKKYTWGSINYFEDYKGGAISIMIEYL